jgi:hypothetical protein
MSRLKVSQTHQQRNYDGGLLNDAYPLNSSTDIVGNLA